MKAGSQCKTPESLEDQGWKTGF